MTPTTPASGQADGAAPHPRGLRKDASPNRQRLVEVDAVTRAPFALRPGPLTPGGPGGSSTPLTARLPIAPPTGGNALLGRCPMAKNCNCVFAPRSSRPRSSTPGSSTPGTSTLGVSTLGRTTPWIHSSGSLADGPAPEAEASANQNGALDAEVSYWTEQGWEVIAARPGEIVVQRSLPESFCQNLMLVVATGLLWSLHWAYRVRHPKIDTRRITTGPDGLVEVETLPTRRRRQTSGVDPSAASLSTRTPGGSPNSVW